MMQHAVNGHSGACFGQGLGQVTYQPGFQAQPGLEQVDNLRGYSTLGHENHFTRLTWPKKCISEVRLEVRRHSG